MKIQFSEQPLWNGRGVNNLSYLTGELTDNPDEQFSESQIRKLLKTIFDLPEEDRKRLGNLPKQVENNSILITVIKGVTDPNAPHMTIEFVDKLHHLSLELNSEGEWKITGAPELSKLSVPKNETLSDEDFLVLQEFQSSQMPILDNHPDVTGHGIGMAKRNSRNLREPALLVFVRDKRKGAEIENQDYIGSAQTFRSPSTGEYFQLRVDIVEGGDDAIEPCDDCDPADLRKKVDPVPMGVSISNATEGTSGTLGGYFYFKRIATVLLSNNHVLKENADKNIIQPGRLLHGTSPADNIALRIQNATNLDASIATWLGTKGRRNFTNKMACTGSKVDKIAAPKLADKIRKVGAKSACTNGSVYALNYKSTSNPSYGTNNILATGEGGPFTVGGDSGSLYELTGSPNTFVALHWGGKTSDSVKYSIAHPLPLVAQTLNLQPTGIGMAEAAVDFAISAANSTDSNHLYQMEIPSPVTGQKEPFFADFTDDLFDRLTSLSGDNPLLSEDTLIDMQSSLIHGDVWRLGLVALTTLFQGKISTLEVVSHRLTGQDIANISRFLLAVEEYCPGNPEITSLHAKILQSEGMTVRDVVRTTNEPVAFES